MSSRLRDGANPADSACASSAALGHVTSGNENIPLAQRTEAPSSPSRLLAWLPALTAALAVVIATCLIVSTYSVFSQTYDEGAHLAAGMEWLEGDLYAYDPINPPLPRIAIALGPYLEGARSQHNADVWSEGNMLLAY